MTSTERLCACVWRSALPLPRSMTVWTVGASLSLAAAGSAGCGAGGSSAPRVERTDSAGIEIVRNGGADVDAGPTRCSVPWEQYVEARGIEEWIPVIRRLAIAPDATIWVERRLVEGGARIDLITADGEYFGTLPAGTPFPAAFTPDGDLIVIEADELDVERLVIYDVMRSATA